jgi:hypothetical protein
MVSAAFDGDGAGARLHPLVGDLRVAAGRCSQRWRALGVTHQQKACGGLALRSTLTFTWEHSAQGVGVPHGTHRTWHSNGPLEGGGGGGVTCEQEAWGPLAPRRTLACTWQHNTRDRFGTHMPLYDEHTRAQQIWIWGSGSGDDLRCVRDLCSSRSYVRKSLDGKPANCYCCLSSAYCKQ